MSKRHNELLNNEELEYISTIYSVKEIKCFKVNFHKDIYEEEVRAKSFNKNFADMLIGVNPMNVNDIARMCFIDAVGITFSVESASALYSLKTKEERDLAYEVIKYAFKYELSPYAVLKTLNKVKRYDESVRSKESFYNLSLPALMITIAEA